MSELNTTACLIEPSLHIHIDKALNVNTNPEDGHEFLRSLNYRIRYSKNDLKSQARKIFLCQSTDLHDYLFPALVDLFITLESKGMGLRRRMLILSRQHLSQTEFLFLRKNLSKNCISEDKDGLPEHCLMSSEIIGKTSELSRIEDTKVETIQENIIETADSYIENCQLTEAIDLYEKELKKDPHNEPYAKQLLDICESSENQERLLSFSQYLFAMTGVRHSSWENSIIKHADK